MKLFRMLGSRGKWEPSKGVLSRDRIKGDAISDLRTQSNELSVWKADDDSDINDAIIAIALSRTHVEKVQYVVLDENDLKRRHIAFKKEIGDIKGLDKSILDKHINLVDIDFYRLGSLAEYILGIVKNEEDKVLNKHETIKLLNEYKKSNKIDINAINGDLRKALKW